ncbi:MAG: hypothetical protein PHX60_02830 [Giesbergeria sp.]|uniref:hypothetical protein n=1 Tax=Giesbergeria sp. TaxID=2818473 RepID=UPI002631CFD9|nr:hypothetical protein [Giesbergeria sp.]MDD2608614.1 hypothetical protein [Giesbergeria sp.]
MIKKKWQLWAVFGSSWLVGSLAWAQMPSAMVLGVQGDVVLELANKTQAQTLEPLVRLLEGDRLRLGSGASVRLLYARSGTQEEWQQAGVLQIERAKTVVLRGQPQVTTRQLPTAISQQMARTPRSDSTGRIGGVRLRNLPLDPNAPPDSSKLAQLEENYQALRQSTPSTDHSPEIYLLAGLRDLAAHERLRTELQRLQTQYPDDAVVARLQTLYAGVLPAPATPSTEDAAK